MCDVSMADPVIRVNRVIRVIRVMADPGQGEQHLIRVIRVIAHG
jgi:hypothetical protein